MTKEEVIGTNTPEEVEGVAQSNRVSLVFKHPEILHTFNNYFLREYGTIQNYRIEVIEELLQSFNETKEIEYKKPLYYEENRKLQEDNNRLITENKNYEKQVQTLKTLTSKLQSYDKLKEDNIKLLEEVKMNTVTIDDLEHKLEKEEKNNIQVNNITESLRTETSNRVKELKEILQSKEEEIKRLRNTYSNYNSLLEENVRLHEKQEQYTLTIGNYEQKLKELENTLILQEDKQEKDIQELYSIHDTLAKEHTETLKNYEQIKEDNIRLTEEVKMNTVTIDDMRKKVNELETVNVTEKQEHLQHIEDLSNKHETRINTIISTHDNTINELISKYEGIIKEKDHEIKELNKLVSGYALNFSNYRAKVESMGLLDRVRKRFPKVNDKIRELNP